MRENEFDIGYRILDDDLIDSDGMRCGKIDDVEIDGEPGSEAKITAILVGSGAGANRLPKPLSRIARRILGNEVVRVDWEEIEDVDTVVRLKRSADELGLGKGDRRAAELVGRIPGS
jgi:sporulation protein YlmC with PRC-barrel domain